MASDIPNDTELMTRLVAGEMAAFGDLAKLR
jgi:hypothetical protein